MKINQLSNTNPLQWIVTFLLLCSMNLICSVSFAKEPRATSADNSAKALRAKYTELTQELKNNQFKRPLYLISEESPNNLKGEIYAVVNHPFAKVNTALNNPAHWCDVLILHINIKYCQASINKTDTILNVNLGKKYDQPLEDTSQVKFKYREMATSPNYFAIQLNAKEGPFGTSNYQILIEATPIKEGKTFLHFTYTYSFGISGRIAMKGYLATIGRDKVGFTANDNPADGQPNYIKGVRGVVERNTMRYYLAIDAYLAALTSPSENQPEKRFQLWYNGTEAYPRQLREVEREDYITMKRKEYKRQQAEL